MSDRTYSEREVAAIIERAAQAQRREAPDDAPGLTLAEIERAGRDAGLDPMLLRRAAAEIDAGLLSAEGARPGTSIAERWIDGPLRPEAWEDAVTALRLKIGAPAGAASDTGLVGDTREWVHSSASGVRTTVAASPRGDRTRVRVVVQDAVVNARMQGTIVGAVASSALALLAGGLVAEGVGLGDLAGVLTAIAVFLVGTAALSETLTRLSHTRRARQSAEADRLADDLARQLAAPEAAVDEPGRAAEPRIEASLLDPLDGEKGEARPGGRRTRT